MNLELFLNYIKEKKYKLELISDINEIEDFFKLNNKKDRFNLHRKICKRFNTNKKSILFIQNRKCVLNEISDIRSSFIYGFNKEFDENLKNLNVYSKFNKNTLIRTIENDITIDIEKKMIDNIIDDFYYIILKNNNEYYLIEGNKINTLENIKITSKTINLNKEYLNKIFINNFDYNLRKENINDLLIIVKEGVLKIDEGITTNLETIIFFKQHNMKKQKLCYIFDVINNKIIETGYLDDKKIKQYITNYNDLLNNTNNYILEIN